MPKKILLADDSITIQKVVELTFSDGDYEVTAVNNGAKAIQKLSDFRPDIILSDIIMPEKNGYEVCEFVKSHPDFRTIPVVLLTGTFEPFDPDRADKAGCDAVVTKPFESQSLIHKVDELIEQARSAAPAATASSAPEPAEPAQPQPSPWLDETPSAGTPAFTPAASFTSAPQPPAAEAPFTHETDIFDAAPEPPAAAEMPIAPPSTDSPFSSADSGFAGETRAFPRMSFDELQGAAPSEPAAPPPPPTPEASPWDEQPAFAGETKAFPRMSFDELARAAEQPATPEPEPPAEPAFADAAAEAEAPFGAPPPAEEFSGETRAFPRMSFDDLQQQISSTAAPAQPETPAEPEPVASAPQPASPWDEPAPAFGGETRAFPRMSFDDLQSAASQAAGAEQSSPWDEPAAAAPPAWAAPSEEAAPEAGDFAPAEEAEPPAEQPEQPAAFAAPQPVEAPAAEPEWAGEAAAPSARTEAPQAASAAGDLTDEQIDKIARRVVQLMSDQVVRNIAWEVIPDLAEVVVKERIRQLEAEA